MRAFLISLGGALLSAVLWFFGISHFLLAACIFLPLMEIFGARRIFPIARFICRNQLRVMGCRLWVEGMENFPVDRACLIMGNHESLFDIFAIIGALPCYVTALEAAAHFRFPIWGHIIRKWGIIPLPERRIYHALQSLDEARQRLEAGEYVVVLPEGHRTRTGNLRPLKKGAFHLALTAEADILPFVFDGLYEFQNTHSLRLHPRKLQVRFCPLLPHESFHEASIDEIRELVRVQLERAIMGKC